MTNKIMYGGWIKALLSDKAKLQDLGVTGEMRYNHTVHCFEYCEATEEVMERLRLQFPGFWPGSFTAYEVTESGEEIQLPREQQKYWGLEH